ncbi:MAG TPA: CHAT domain-containing protein [Thermoanaerobaculia bacterium]|jgi:CHAT domain-containing protein
MRRSAAWWGIGSVLAVASVLALAWHAWRPPQDFTGALETVQQRLGHRLLPARLTGVEHAPYPVRRGGGDRQSVLDELAPQELFELSVAIRALDASSSGFRARVGQGILEIATGGSETDLTEVIEMLETEAGRRAGDPALLNDLAALTLSRALEFGQPQDLLAAFDLAERALKLRPNLAPARFNKALALDELSLALLAESAWEDYLELDRRSGWAQEASQRLDELRRKEPAPHWKDLRPQWEEMALRGDQTGLQTLFSPFRSEAVRWVERELTAAWLAALEDDPGNAERSLKIGRELAAALAALTGDPYPVKVVAAIDAPATVVAGAPDRRAPVDAHRRYLEALEALEENDLEAARVLFAEARHRLAAIGSPLHLRALYELAVMERKLQNYREAQALIGEILADPKAPTFLLLWGETHWIVALGLGETGYPERALEACHKALAAFEMSGDPDRYVGIQSVIAEILDVLGRSREAWHHRALALRRVAELSNPMRSHQTYAAAAVAAWQEGYWSMALAFEDMAVPSSRDLADPLVEPVSLIWRGRMKTRMGDREAASKDLAEARGLLAKVQPRELVLNAAANLLTAEGELRIHVNPAETVERMTAAIEIYRGSQQRSWLASALVTRSLAHLELGDLELAAADLNRCIRDHESTRGELTREQRISFFEQTLRIFDGLTELQLEQEDFASALSTTDERRGRNLLDAFLRTTALTPPPGSQPAAELLPIEEIQASVPDDAALLEYTRLGERWWVGVVRRDALVWEELPLAGAELDAQVMEFQNAVSEAPGAAEIRKPGERLYEALIAPVARHLGGVERLVIVPDGLLHALPFDALTNPSSGRLVVQDYRVSFAASANLYARSRRRDAELASTDQLEPLIVGNPEFDRRRYNLRDLPGAADEARRVAKVYRVADPLIGFAATKERFLALAAEAPLIHFGGHAVPNHQAPGRSYLLLAPTAGSDDPGALYSQEISGLRLPRTRLVVLAACSTARGQTLRGEGVFSLAYAFQSAGVPGVVASLWDVDDAVTAELLWRLHEQLAAGRSADDALQRAKISLIELADDELEDGKEFGRPAAWAAFQVFGEATFHPEGGKQNGF